MLRSIFQAAPAVCSGIAVHLLLHNFEPSDAVTALIVIVLGPAILFVPSFRLDCYIIATYAVYLSSLAFSVLLYRISPFHPLAGIPGPFWLKFSKISGMWMSYTGKMHVIVKDLHDIYGPVVRTGRFLQPSHCAIFSSMIIVQDLMKSALST